MPKRCGGVANHLWPGMILQVQYSIYGFMHVNSDLEVPILAESKSKIWKTNYTHRRKTQKYWHMRWTKTLSLSLSNHFVDLPKKAQKLKMYQNTVSPTNLLFCCSPNMSTPSNPGIPRFGAFSVKAAKASWASSARALELKRVNDGGSQRRYHPGGESQLDGMLRLGVERGMFWVKGTL